MNYVDTSVLLAQLMAEDRVPPAELWNEPIVTSRLAEYELRVRLNARRLSASHEAAASALLARLAWLELVPPVLSRALAPFPTPVRTLDALHLASADFLRERGQPVKLASYDARFNAAGAALGFELYAGL